MGKLEAFGIEGVYCWFWSQDHRPPHFHAKQKGKWSCRVFFLRARAKMLEHDTHMPERMDKRHRKILCDMAEQHREELLREWERKVKCDD